jgi:hypothetical protein
MRVFVPDKWDGINGIEDLKIEFSEDMPTRIKPAQRPIPQKIFAAAKEEFFRMIQYFYEESNSPIASPVVFAPKSTHPFVRCCGDYRMINKFVKAGNYPIPDVIRELHRAAGFTIFVDLDVRNAFHEIRLHISTSRVLSIQTPWGQFQPKFLPEGVAPASGILMQVMYELFADCVEWIIVIFDNILVLATDYEDCLSKLKIIVGRCRQRNVFLKLSKSKFGVRQVEFFGYVVEGNTYRLSDERANSVSAIPFPENSNQVKKMQRFLGAAIYFRPFIPDFAERTNKLYEMT